jgi:hypothetical protein
MTDDETLDDTDLHTALAAAAGPVEPPPAAARLAVRDRVRRGRRRLGATSVASALALAAAVGGLTALVAGGDDPAPAARPSPGHCTRLPRPVPAADVPAPVAMWADGRPLVGTGSLWTARTVLRQRANRVEGGWRIKLGWYVHPAGPDATPPTLTARRIDGPGRATGEAGAATDQHGTWFASAITLPHAGCWQITATHGSDTVRFRIPAAGAT